MLCTACPYCETQLSTMADLMRRLVPEARVAVAHGQMPGDTLELLRTLREEIGSLLPAGM